MSYKIGTKDKPLALKTPPLTSDYTMHVDQKDGKEVLVCTVGKTVLLYNIDILDDMYKMLKSMETGWNWEVQTNKNLPKKVQLKPGDDLKIIRLVDGME